MLFINIQTLFIGLNISNFLIEVLLNVYGYHI